MEATRDRWVADSHSRPPRHTDSSELLSLASAQAGLSNEARYGIQLKPGANRSRLLEDLLALTGNNRVAIQKAAEPETSI